MPPASNVPAARARAREEILIGLDADADNADRDLEGYDTSQRAEILEVMANGPSDGVIQFELLPDVQDNPDWR